MARSSSFTPSRISSSISMERGKVASAWGIIGTPHQAVHPDDVPQPDANLVFLEAEVHVLAEEIAGHHVVPEAGKRLLSDVRYRCSPWCPAGGPPTPVRTQRWHLQLGITVKHPRENHVAQRRRRQEHLVGPIAGYPHRVRACSPVVAYPAGGGVEAEGHVQVLRQRPERFVLRQVVPSFLRRVLANHGPGAYPSWRRGKARASRLPHRPG